jgi:cyanate permease
MNRNETQTVFAAEKKEKPDVKALFSKSEYWLFFIFLFVFCFPINAANTFFPRLLLEKGSSNQIIALFGSINAIVEIPFLLYGKNLARKTGSRGLMLIGCMFTVVRMAGFAFAGSVPLLLLSHLGAAPYVGFFVPGFIYYSYSISPKNTEAFTLTSLQGLAIGFTGMLGSFFSGIIVDSKGIQAMFAYYSLICITGIIIFIFTSVWLKKKSSA